MTARERLATFYNGDDYNASTNPGGMADGGHRTNFEDALQDVATVGEETADFADDAETSATEAAASAAAASSSASAASTSASTASTQASNASASAAAAASSVATLLKFLYNSATSGDPGSGKFRFDNGTFLSATKIAFSETDANSNALADLFAALDDGTGTNKFLVVLTKVGGSAYYSGYVTSTLTDNGSWDEFNFTPIATDGSISNGDSFVATFIPLQKGDTGSTGSAGADGANAGNKYTFNSATSGDPGSGKFLLNNATLASATQLNIYETDGNSNDLSALLAALDNGTSTNKALLTFQNAAGTKGIVGLITAALTDAGSYDTYPWTPITSWGSPANNDVMYLVATLVGDKGDTGSTGSTGSAGADGANGGNKYTFNSSTSGDPASGKFLFNNATFASATAMNISETDGNGGAIASWLATLDDSTSTVKTTCVFKSADGTKGFVVNITGTITDSGSYDTFSVTPVVTWGSISDGDVFYLSTSRSGDKGDTGASGPGGGDLVSTNNLSDVDDAATAFANIKQAATTSATGVVELATTGEAGTGTDTSRAVVPSGLFPDSVDVASASTTDLGAVASSLVRITGTTTITAFGTIAAGIRKTVRFAGALILTHNGTSLILPTAANITTAAGDTAEFVSEGSGNWRCLRYQPASGRTLLAASTTQSGDVELATVAEAATGTDTVRAVTPAGLFPDSVDVASASTTDLGAVASSLVRITGTTTITAFGTIAAGIRKTVRFAGALILTHNGTSLILPTAANITTAAGDTAEFVSEGSGNWRCLRYQPASGRTLLAASATQSGDVELATVAEAATGTDTVRAVTPAGLFPAEATVASASTTNIGAATTTKVQITGTTTITAFDNVAAGIFRAGRFAGALTFTHNGTSLIIPGAANITTAANDRFGALSLGSGNWLVLWYQKASGKAIIAPTAADVGLSGSFVGTSDSQTLSNKRVTKRTGSTSSSATPTINTDNVDIYSLTAQSAAITSFTTNLSGTPVDGDMLLIRITDNGTARAITWGSSFEASTVALPTTTVISTLLSVLFQWNTATSKWRCVGVA